MEVSFGQPVTECSAEGVVYGGQPLPAKTIIWAAGVTASPAARWLKTEADRAGRVIVGADLTLPLHPEIFVIGDTAAVTGEDGRMIPGIAPAAKQEGQYVAKLIQSRLKDEKPVLKPSGTGIRTSATIGRGLAVVDMGRLKLRGAMAWWFWKIIHLYF